ncbi:MAG: dockerin type I domain-containing protein [Candidatus Saccharimonadia bacterium]
MQSTNKFVWIPGIFIIAATVLIGYRIIGHSKAANLTAITAKSSDSFVDSIGLNIHSAATGGGDQYGSQSQWVPLLQQLGVRHVRDAWISTRVTQEKTLYASLKTDGIGVDIIVNPIPSSTTAQAIVSSISQNYPIPDAFEGLNEVDNNGWTNWVSIAQTQQQALYAAVKADPNDSSVPVLGFTLTGGSASYAQVGDMSSYLDYGNFHPYPGGRNPESNIVANMNLQNTISANKPLYATETGYHADLNSTTSRSMADWPVSDPTFATYYTRMLLNNFRLGIKRTYGYEFLDELPDSGLSIQEQEYGLVRDDWSLTPAYTTLENLISLLSDPGASFTPAALTYSLTGTDAATTSVLLQKRDGTFWLAVWEADNIWNGTTRQAITTSPINLTLNLAQSASVAQYHPDLNNLASQASNNATSYNFSSSSNVTLLEISGSKNIQIPGDANGDGVVNILDLSILASNWGKTNATWSEGDFNGDGVVNITDLSILAANY